MGDEYLDNIRHMVGYADPDADDTLLGAQDMWTDDVPTWAVLRTTGATRNDYDELVGGVETATLLTVINIPLTERVKESIGGDWSEVDTMFRGKPGLVLLGDLVRAEPDDGVRYKVRRLDTPRIGAEAVCENVLLGKVYV